METERALFGAEESVVEFREAIEGAFLDAGSVED